MKNLIKNITLLVIMFLVNLSMANEPKINLETSESGKILVLKMNTPTSDFTLKLMDENSNIIYSENILNSSYAKEFNMKDLKNGTYYFSLENSAQSVIYTLNFRAGAIKIENRKVKSNKPVFKVSEKKIYVNLLNETKQQVQIKIVDEQNRKIFNSHYDGDFRIGEILNFEKAVKGNYTVVVEEGDQKFLQSIKID